jgi:hypothetical protein
MLIHSTKMDLQAAGPSLVFSSTSLHFFDVGQLPASVLGSLLRAVETEEHEEPSIGGRWDPVGLFASGSRWAKVDIDASVGDFAGVLCWHQVARSQCCRIDNPPRDRARGLAEWAR